MLIVVSPYSRPLKTGKPSPKNYPHWPRLIALLKRWDTVVQIGVSGEADLHAHQLCLDLSLDEVAATLQLCDTWVSVDNCIPHLAHHVRKPGVVLWGPSDPEIFGYPENTNLLRSREVLRPAQFATWEECEPRDDIFVSPLAAYFAVLSLRNKKTIGCVGDEGGG